MKYLKKVERFRREQSLELKSLPTTAGRRNRMDVASEGARVAGLGF